MVCQYTKRISENLQAFFTVEKEEIELTVPPQIEAGIPVGPHSVSTAYHKLLKLQRCNKPGLLYDEARDQPGT